MTSHQRKRYGNYLYLIYIFQKCLFEMYFNQKSAWPIVEITKQNRMVLHKEIYIWYILSDKINKIMFLGRNDESKFVSF